jgi:hypothetical protein
MLKFSLIDKYMSKFEELTCQVNYMARNPETRQMFLKGLPRNILKDIIKMGAPPTYQDLKQQTINAVRVHQTIDNILKWRNNTFSTPSNPFRPSNQWGHPFYWGNQQYDSQQTKEQPQQHWNSSNAPRNINNMPVPMDIDWARAYQGRRYQGRVATLDKPGGPKGRPG